MGRRAKEIVICAVCMIVAAACAVLAVWLVTCGIEKGYEAYRDGHTWGVLGYAIASALLLPYIYVAIRFFNIIAGDFFSLMRGDWSGSSPGP